MPRTTPTLIVIFIIAVISIAGCSSTSIPDTAIPMSQNGQAVITIEGMACPFCIYNVQRQLEQVEGVQHTDIDLKTGKAFVTLSKEKPPTADALRKAVKSSGFTPTKVQMP